MVSLHSELESQETYLAIETVRFADRLQVMFSVDPEVRQALVPTLILQPLVENAVTHGLGRSLRGAAIEIGARRVGDRLQLWVQDDAMADGPRRPGLGIGLDNIRSRLSTQYGGDATLVAGPTGSGWRSEIDMPFEVEVSDSSPVAVTAGLGAPR
jgi:LytS/YehU family sensor histidine kinase